MMRPAALACLFAALLLPLVVAAKTLRWSSQGDVSTMDPHSFNEALNNNISLLIYEPLVYRDKQFKIDPELAIAWSQPSPTLWRFELRPGVRFHDGTPFTAEDVVFSIERAQAPNSGYKAETAGIAGVRKTGELTVEITTAGPNPVLLQQLTDLRIVSKEWAEKHGVTKPQSFKDKEETFAVRNTNGTGPYMLKVREADVKPVLVENPDWWRKRDGNVTEMVYLPIKSAATRVAALLSGELDFVLDPPPQDLDRLLTTPGIQVVEGPEFRVIYLGLDQFRDELLYSNVKGKNPFKDLRVRQAIYQAIDIEAIRAKVMRGQSVPVAVLVGRGVAGYSAAVDKRPPLDREKARTLLAEAGYPDGFEVTLDCPNNRYINDEQICQAVSAMLAQIGVTARLNAMPRAPFFAKLDKRDTSFYLMGWTPPTYDALNVLQVHAHTPGSGGDGDYNRGGYSNPKLDGIIDQIKVELDHTKRNALIAEALAIVNADVGYVPLHQQIIPWAMRAGMKVVHHPSNQLIVHWVEMP